MLTEENKPGYCDADDSANIRIVAYAQKGDRCETRQCAKDLACSSFGPATPKRCTTPDLKAQIDNAPKVNCYQAPENTICAQPGTGILGKCITSRNIRTCQVQNIEPAIVSPLTSYGGFNNSSMTIATGQTLDPGRYQLNSGTTLNLVSPATINFFADMNGNGVREENESLVTGQTFELQKQSESFSYELLNGWNALNFPFYQDSSTPYKASDLRAAAASQGMDIVSIKKWEGKWVEYTVSDGTVFGKDFILRPNEGYFVKTTVRGTVSLFGTTPKTSVPMQLNNGWSLVGVAPGYGENKSKNYNQAPFKNGVKAFEFLEVFNTADSSLQADNITRYDSGVYRGVSLGDSANGKKLQFGIDYEVDDLSAYFVKAKKKVTIAP
jgi:hypothetical protein